MEGTGKNKLSRKSIFVSSFVMPLPESPARGEKWPKNQWLAFVNSRKNRLKTDKGFKITTVFVILMKIGSKWGTVKPYLILGMALLFLTGCTGTSTCAGARVLA